MCTRIALAALLLSARAFAEPPVEKDDATLLALAAEQAERQSPAEVVAQFLAEAHQGDFVAAASALSLEHLPPEERTVEGPRLALRLMFLLDQRLKLEAEAKAPADPSRTLAVVGELPLRRFQVPVELVRQPAGESPAWKVSPRTVRAIDLLYEELGSPLWELLPPALVNRSFWVLGAWQWLGLVLLVALSLALARLVTAVLTPMLQRVAKLTVSTVDDELTVKLRRPAQLLLFLVLLGLGTRALAFPITAQGPIDDVLRSLAVATLVWAVILASRVIADAIERRASEQHDAISARAVKTQVSVLHRVANAVVFVVGGALVLLQFPGVRHIGMSMLASAGVAGVVIGLAAQKSISNLLAGIQLSLTQPMRIGDTVIVEGEWGWVEEITLTYVVVKVWDLRRLVVPISTFLDKPFQNWSRQSTEILGTVEIFVDWRLNVAEARAELMRIVESARGGLWNGKVVVLQVTNFTDRAMTLRALVSADDSGKAFDLRCLVRERLVDWLQQQPEGLPQLRTVLSRASTR